MREIDNYVFNHIHLYINLLTLNLKEFLLELYAKKITPTSREKENIDKNVYD